MLNVSLSLSDCSRSKFDCSCLKFNFILSMVLSKIHYSKEPKDRLLVELLVGLLFGLLVGFPNRINADPNADGLDT